MEDFASTKWTTELEKSLTTFLKSPLSFQRSFDNPKPSHLDSLESSLIMSDFLAKPPLDACDILSDHKDDGFLLEPVAHLNVGPSHEAQNEESTAQLDISVGNNNHLLRPLDYDLDGYQIRRSRGPSFDIGCDKGGGEEIFSTDVNFARFFNDHGAHHFLRNAAATDFLNCPQNTINHQENLPFDPSLDEEITFQDPLEDQISTQDVTKVTPSPAVEKSLHDSYTHNMSCSSENSFSTTEDLILAKQKKKRKNSKTITRRASKVVQKIQKPKKETKKQKAQTLLSKAHSLPLEKPSKGSENTDPNITNPLNSLQIKQLSSKSQPADNFPENAKIEVKEEATESTSNTTNKKATKAIGSRCSSDKAAAILTISQSLREQKLENIDGLFQGLDLPPEVHDFISKSKLFTKSPLLSTRKVGTLTCEERRAKVEKYLQKRKDRTWTKKINYDCRKKVADTRLRFKGRFVTRSQVFRMLEEEGIHLDPSRTTEEEIKTILEERFGHDIEKPKPRERDESRGERIDKKIKKNNSTASVMTKRD